MNNPISDTERRVWRLSVLIAGALCLAAGVLWGVAALTANSEINASQARIDELSSKVAVADQINSKLTHCEDAWRSLNSAADGYLQAGLKWSDEMFTMLDYGIFAGNVIAFVAIPQMIQEADSDLASADSIGCSAG